MREKDLENNFPMIVIGSSTGGTSILTDFFKRLPSDTPCCFLVVQHFPMPSFAMGFVEHLKTATSIDIDIATDGACLASKKAFVIPSGYKINIVKNKAGTFGITMKPLINDKISLTINPVMRTVAEVFGSRSIGIILTGMGNDGLEGAQAIKAHGGYMIVQRPDTCVVDSMPQNVIKAGLADAILTPLQIVQKLFELTL